MITPGLSTVRLPLREMGRRGFEYADRLLAGKHPRRELMPTTVVMRDSTGAPPAVALRGERQRSMAALRSGPDRKRNAPMPSAATIDRGGPA